MNAPTKAEFLERRKSGLGGSDLGAILGLSKYKSPVQVWLEKTGRAEPVEETLQMRFGTFAEDFVAQEYTRDTGRRVQRFNGLLRHPDFQMVIGNVDRLVIPDGAKVASFRSEIRTDRGWEGKTANAFAARDTDDWGPGGTDLVPPAYCVQCSTYLALTNCAEWDLSVMFGNQEIRHYTIRRDMDLEQEILRRAAEWWAKHIEADVAPEPQSESDVRLLYPRDNAMAITATCDVAAGIAELIDIRASIKEFEKLEQAARDRVTAYMGEAAVLHFDGETLATYKAARDGSKTDWKATANDLRCYAGLDADAPAYLAAVAKNTTTTTGARRLLLK